MLKNNEAKEQSYILPSLLMFIATSNFTEEQIHARKQAIKSKKNNKKLVDVDQSYRYIYKLKGTKKNIFRFCY